jgi:hypothetical protein
VTRPGGGRVEVFDRSRLRVLPLSARHHDLDLGVVRPLAPAARPFPALAEVAARMKRARASGSSIVWMIGAHVLRSGVQHYLLDLLERGFVSCLALNGGGMIHDWELSLAGATTESVARYISEGQFGLWRETGVLNDVVAAAPEGGIGKAVGEAIRERLHPHRQLSVLAAGAHLEVPVTVHMGIGYDIVHEHPNCDGAAWGRASYVDFLRYARVLEGLEGGVVMNFGSAVMAPEVYLKALAMVRNVAHQEGRRVSRFTTLVCDLLSLPQDIRTEPARGEAAYYYRPWKTMLARTVADGGESFYVQGRHAETIPQLWTELAGA